MEIRIKMESSQLLLYGEKATSRKLQKLHEPDFVVFFYL
jgi:hypothetical protein